MLNQTSPLFKGALLNTSAQLGGRIVSSGLTFLGTLFLARVLGSYFFGEYTKIVSYIALFYTLVDLGLNTVYLRQLKTQAIFFSSLLSLRLVISLVTGVVAIVGIILLSYLNPGFTPLVVIGVVIGFLSITAYAIFISTNAVFQAKLRYDLSSLAQGLGSLASFLLLVYFYQALKSSHLGVLFGVVMFVTSGLVTCVTSLVLVRKFVVFGEVNLDWHRWRLLIQQSLPLGMTLAFNVVYFRLDTLILTSYRSSFEVGAYGLAYKFFELAITLPTFLMNSIYPNLLTFKTTVKSFWTDLKPLFIILFSASIIMATGFWFAAPLLTLVNSDFQASIILLRILVISLPIFFLTSPLMWLFVLFKKEKYLVYIYAGSLIFNIVANLVFVPIFGALAASVITAVTEVIVLILGILFLIRLGEDSRP